VHSPFVYNIVAKGFYKSTDARYNGENNAVALGLNKNALQTLFKTIAYFKSYKLLTLGEETPEIMEIVQSTAEKDGIRIWFYSPYAPIPGGFDLAYIPAKDPDTSIALLTRLRDDSNNNSVLAIGNIHTSAENEAAWEAIKNDPNVTVSIDTYHLGLVFFRQGQSKQHFIIRPNKSFLTDTLLGIRNLWGLLS